MLIPPSPPSGAGRQGHYALSFVQTALDIQALEGQMLCFAPGPSLRLICARLGKVGIGIGICVKAEVVSG